MVGWFQNFLRTIRISFRAKNVSRKLNKLSSEQGAHVALMAALIKIEMLNDRVPGSELTIKEIAESPLTYPKDLSYKASCLLKEKRELARARVKSYATNKIVPPLDVYEHMELCDLALSLWMITIAVRCGPSTLERVTSCWRSVISHSPSATDVRAIMIRSDYGFCNFRSQPIATKEWIWLASKMPSFLDFEQGLVSPNQYVS